jgi:hypothetical protein
MEPVPRVRGRKQAEALVTVVRARTRTSRPAGVRVRARAGEKAPAEDRAAAVREAGDGAAAGDSRKGKSARLQPLHKRIV